MLISVFHITHTAATNVTMNTEVGEILVIEKMNDSSTESKFPIKGDLLINIPHVKTYRVS